MSSSPHPNNTVSYRNHEAILRCDLQHVDSSLGSLVQTFTRRDEEYEHLDNRQYWESTFRLFLQGGITTLNAKDLTRSQKDMIWNEIFVLKNKFLREQKPDVVIHRVKHPFPFARRLALYQERLDLTDYDLWHSGSLIWLERKP